MPKVKVKPFNDNQWTEARFNAFIKSALRSASLKWPPRNKILKEKRISRGMYICRGYERAEHVVRRTILGKNNIFVDHIDPVIDPVRGFHSWDAVIKKMFVDSDGLQLLCKECHDKKTKDERERAKQRGSN